MPITKLLYSFIENGPLTGSLFGTASYALDSVYSASLASRSTILESASSSFSTRVTSLVTDSGSFSTRAATLEIASGSFSTRITNLVTDSGSFSSRATTLETASGSFSTRVTNLISDSGSFSTRVTNLVTDSSSFSNRTATLETASGSFSTRVTNLVTDSSSFSARLSSYTGSIFGTASYATKAETLVSGININAGLITASAISVTTLSVVTITSSIDYASGSNIFGTKSTDTQLFTGSVSMSGSLSVVGNVTSNNVLSLASGTVALPSLILSTDTTSGMYRIGANNIGISISAAKVLDISSTGLSVTGALSATTGLTLNDGSANSPNINFQTTSGTRIMDMDGSTVRILNMAATNARLQLTDAGNLTVDGSITGTGNSLLNFGGGDVFWQFQSANNYVGRASTGEVWLNVAASYGVNLGVAGTSYARVSSTGLAVTGALSSTGLSKNSYSVSTGALAAFASASGGLYNYYSGGGIIGAFSDDVGTRATLSLVASSIAINPAGSTVGLFTTTGLAVTGALDVTSTIGLIRINSSADLDTTGYGYISYRDNSTGSYAERAYVGFGAGNGNFNLYSAAPGKVMTLGADGVTSVLTISATGLAVTGAITATGNITAYFSDDRLKTKLGKIENALDKICSLEGFYYEANDLAQSLGYKAIREVGISAQSVQSVLPEIVKPAPIDSKYLTIQYERTVPLIIEAIKELRNEINALKK
jgi:hypothetical protein